MLRFTVTAWEIPELMLPIGSVTNNVVSAGPPIYQVWGLWAGTPLFCKMPAIRELDIFRPCRSIFHSIQSSPVTNLVCECSGNNMKPIFPGAAVEVGLKPSVQASSSKRLNLYQRI